VRLDVDVKWWHIVGGLFILLFGIPYLVGSVRDLGSARVDSPEEVFSEAEKAQLRALQPELDSLVLSEQDIGHIPGEFYDCTDPDIKAAVDYDTDDQGNDEVDVTTARLDGVSSRPRGDSEFCKDEDGSWIASHASTEATKSELLHDLSVLKELAKGKQEDVAAVLMPMAEYHAQDGEVLDAEWLPTDSIGDASFGIQATVSLDSGVYRVYRTTFIRGVVWAGITVRFPESGDALDDAIGLARAYDEKIQSRARALSADARVD
jgi:hypothetical protein